MKFSLKMLCRTCMCEDGIVSSIFDTKIEFEDNMYSFAEMLTSCTNIQIKHRDHLTEYICEECQKQLSTAFSFKKQSERVDSILRKIGNNTNDDIIKLETILDSDVEEQYEITAIDKSNFLLSAEFLDESQYEIPITDKSIELNDMNNKNTFMLTAEFLNDSTIIDKPNEIIKAMLLDEQDEIATINKSIEITNDMNNRNNFMLKAEFLNDDILLKQNRDNSKKKQSNKLIIKEVNSTIAPQLNTGKRLKLTKDYCCEICGRTVHSKCGFNYHMKMHKGIKSYICTHPNCGKRFIWKQALDTHIYTHTRIQKHLCPECGKVYRTAKGLEYHLKGHQDKRPFACMHCDKKYINAFDLKNHMWVHSGIKPHVCKSCGKCYTKKFQLQKHMKKFCPSALQTAVS